MTDQTPQGHQEYLQDQMSERAARVQTIIDTLTPFERKLLREAMVMGAAYGTRFGPHDPLPKDYLIIRRALDGALALPERFPLLGHLANGERPRVGPVAADIPALPDQERP